MKSRWDTRLEDKGDKYTLILEPKAQEMADFMIEASRKLTAQIMESEEKLVLQCLTDATLKRMIGLCEQELERRK